MKTFHFPKQKASDECPAVPRGTSVKAKTFAEATKKLASVLKEDPKLDKKHPELLGETKVAKTDEKPQNEKAKSKDK